MPAVRCPECSANFKAVSTSARIACPKCGTKFTVNARKVAVEDDVGDAPASNRRQIIMIVVAGMAVVYLVGGIVLAMYLMKGSKKPADQPVAAAEKAAALVEAPVVVPVPPPAPAPEPRPAEPRPAEPKAADPVPMPEPKPPTEPPAADPKAAQQVKINKAIDKGTEFLKQKLGEALEKDRSSYGEYEGLISLMSLTLLECGVPAKDPLIQKAASVIRASAPHMSSVYAMSPAILFLDRLGDPRNKDLIQSFTLRLMSAQTLEGNWGYNPANLNDAEEKQLFAYLKTVTLASPKGDPRLLTPKLLELAVVRWLQGQKLTPFIVGDNSNTQFALLALWVGQRHGMPAYASLSMAEQYFRNTQLPDGSWMYNSGAANHRASMTCTGLLGLSMGRTFGNKAKGKPGVDPAVEKGFRFLSETVAEPATRRPLAPAPGNAPPAAEHAGKLIGADAGGDLYFLWSLERVALVYGLKVIGGRDWYEWASGVIVGAQQQDGSWTELYGGLPETCFALLVLKRVNVIQDLAVHADMTESIKKVVSIKASDDKDTPPKK